MKKLSLVAAGVLFSALSYGQTIGQKPPKVMLISYDKNKEDGDLMLKIDVKMADCVSHIQLKNKSTRKPKLVNPTIEDYYLDERNQQDIWLKLPIGRLNELLRKHDNEETEIIVYSKSGKPVYQTYLALNKSELVGDFDTHEWR